eukprot:gb/GECG01013075.1/.p1 GENE.gb/GECG01013075.1/~~gb/GECG01013075.1/.p1  ORF type:complete len:213 (+),score=14.69 gb/GECG01013075.1/:1-639(+)
MKTKIQAIVRRSFGSLCPSGQKGIPTFTAMMTLYAAMELNAEDSELANEMIDCLIVGSSVAVLNKQALLNEEPFVKECIRVEAQNLLNGHKQLFYRTKLNSIITEMVHGNLLISHSGLGERTEPLLCHHLLMTAPTIDKSSRLWDRFQGFLGYLQDYVKGDDPVLSEQAGNIIEDLLSERCEIRVCNNLSRLTEKQRGHTVVSRDRDPSILV